MTYLAPAARAGGRNLNRGAIPATVEESHTPAERRRALLTLTENASTIVKTITDQTTDSEDAGLRFSQEAADASALAITTADAPEPGDQVVEDGGARVFLEENAAGVLDDKVLDAQVDDTGSVQFSIAPQG